MTSINAIRFNHHQGAMLCDETISCGDGQAVHASDKVQNCIPKEVKETYGTMGAIATTGSCAIGQTFKNEFHDWILATYRAEVEKIGQKPATFLDLDQLAVGMFDMVIRYKHQWMSEWLKAEYGFGVKEFIAGHYQHEGKKVEIKDSDLKRKITDWFQWKHEAPQVEGIFLNAGLFAGYDDSCGFQIYHFDLREGYWHRVQTCYFSEGSGRWSADPTMYPFVERLRIDERRGQVCPVEGLTTLIAAVNSASEHEAGVGGYPSIVLFDGKEPIERRQREVSDERSFIATRIIKAFSMGYLDKETCYKAVDGLFYKDEDPEEIYQHFWQKAKEPERLCRLLRGYKVPPYSG